MDPACSVARLPAYRNENRRSFVTVDPRPCKKKPRRSFAFSLSDFLTCLFPRRTRTLVHCILLQLSAIRQGRHPVLLLSFIGLWPLIAAIALRFGRDTLLVSLTRLQMASATRQFARVAVRTTARNTFAVAPRQAFRQQGRRWYSSEPSAQKGSSTWLYLTGAAAAGGLGFWYYTASGAPSAASSKVVNPTKEDYQKVYNEIARRLDEKDDYDDGSFGPVLLRLAWHASGTYDKATGTGGSNGATMRFAPESDHGANAGLLAARKFLDPVKGKLWHLWIFLPASD